MDLSSHAIFTASDYARQGKLIEMQKILEQATDAGASYETLIQAGNLCLAYGLVSVAKTYFSHALQTEPTSMPALAGLARAATEVGKHDLAYQIYEDLVSKFPDNETLRRNALVAMQYNPAASVVERVAQAQVWGHWAIARAGGEKPRPRMRPLTDGMPRVGVVSADLCQHTVGLFVKDMLRALGQCWPVVAYQASNLEDWVSKLIKSTCQWRNVAAIDDAKLSSLIRADEIDVLIDLSGHTAGSRLGAFAYRPAPVMVSWLGYFATTGLPYMDAVLLDQWHAPPGTEAQFVEPIEYLPAGRFHYGSVPWAPKEVADPPCLRNGYVTFGSFNNTAKLNSDVFDIWAKVLNAVPASRLVMKWRTLNDQAFVQSVRDEFIARRVDPQRIELRGAGFHVEVLKEYADIDIALDPFPFTGGLTSCEALWMGVPVVTWPQGPVVSRQTLGLLYVIGLQDLVAVSADTYVDVATTLAQDRTRLVSLRHTLRAQMQASSLMDVSAALQSLKQTLLSVYSRVLNNPG